MGVVFRDSFRGGKAELTWRPFPMFNQDNLRGAIDPTSPGEGHGIGVLDNANAGGFVALSYAAVEVPRDFVLQAWLYAVVTEEKTGPHNGVAFRVDPAGDRFYRVAARFTAEPTLSLAYVGADSRHFPVYLHRWTGAELPGGLPSTSGWHRVRVEVSDNHAEVYWDGIKLPGGPFPIDRCDAGFVGVYANLVGGPGRAETRVADFRVESVL